RFDAYETPRLAVADRRREGGEAQEFLDEQGRDRVRLEAAYITPPCEKFCQAVAEGAVEDGRIALLYPAPHRRLRRTTWNVMKTGQHIRSRTGNAARRRPRRCSPCL